MMKRALAVAVHPDDETLGCGGTLLRHRSNGDEIFWLIVSGMTAETGYTPSEIQSREKEIRQVAEDFGFQDVFQLGLPTTALDTVPLTELISKIAKVIHSVQPQVVYLPFRSDVHSDHRVAFDAAWSCLKTFRAPFVRRTLMMETLSETEFAPPMHDSTFCPNVFVDISPFMVKKLQILQNYSKEISGPPSPRSLENIRALATYRGATCGCNYAEAFMLLKEVL